MRILLASTSTWRLQLLKEAGIACMPVDPGVDEALIQRSDPVELALARACAKAAAVSRRWPDEWVVGADQVAHLDGMSFGKPVDRAAWRRQLFALRGRTHSLTTGVSIEGPEISRHFHVSTQVVFRSDIEDAEIEAYIDLGEAQGCAGGYMVERRGAWLVERCEGDWCNVIGLPVLSLIGELRGLGWRLSADGGGRG
jgi:septum formation protein